MKYFQVRFSSIVFFFVILWHDPSSAPIGVLSPAVALETRERAAPGNSPSRLLGYYFAVFVVCLVMLVSFVAGRGVGVMLLPEAFLFVIMLAGRIYKDILRRYDNGRIVALF